MRPFLKINAEKAKIWPPITTSQEPLKEADEFNGMAGKLKYLSE